MFVAELKRRTMPLACLLIMAAGGCSFESHREIYGRWRSSQLSLAGIAIPVAPSMEFSAHQVIVGDKSMEIDSYEIRDTRFVVNLKGSVSLTFEMDGNDAMLIELPLIGRIKYIRIK